MAKICTIRRQSEFKNVFGAGTSYPARYFVLYVLPNALDTRRFGFTAGKKIGNAVVRNRLKRLFKETVRKNADLLPAGYDFILVARSAGVGKSYAEVEEDFKKLLTRKVLVGTNRREDLG